MNIEQLRKKQREIWALEETINTELQNFSVRNYAHSVGETIELPAGRATKYGRIVAITGEWESDNQVDDSLHPVIVVHYKPVKADGTDSLHYGSRLFITPGASAK